MMQECALCSAALQFLKGGILLMAMFLEHFGSRSSLYTMANYASFSNRLAHSNTHPAVSSVPSQKFDLRYFMGFLEAHGVILGARIPHGICQHPLDSHCRADSFGKVDGTSCESIQQSSYAVLVPHRPSRSPSGELEGVEDVISRGSHKSRI